MNNLIHNFPIYYAYSVNKAYRELNLERVLDEDTGVFLFFLLSSLVPLGQTAVSGNFTLHH